MAGSFAEPRIRAASSSDAAGMAGLSAQLGYPVSAEIFGERLGELLPSPKHAVFVAEGAEGGLCGFIAAERRLIIESGERVEITALVVDAQVRRAGIGRALVAQAERWAVAIGTPDVFLRSNIVRPESHPFYESLGFERTKTQHVYRKRL